jgi:ABC-type multidrug transport system fused ATPase/permease subunit
VLPTEGNSQTKPGKISDNWPKHGEIDFIHYTLAYQEDLPPVLKDITFKVCGFNRAIFIQFL